MKFETSPAFPTTPVQDSFGRMVVPVPGLTKIEFFALELYKTYCLLHKEELGTNEYIGPEKLMATSIQDAEELLKLLEKKLTDLTNETINSNNQNKIIQ